MPTQHGSKAWQGNFTNIDATVVFIARAAGALILAKAVGSFRISAAIPPDQARPLAAMVREKS
jgi:hypothetical protein